MYEYYKNEYKGIDITENVFKKYFVKAKALINYYTFNRINWDDIDDNVKNCLCELVEVIKRDEDIRNGKIVKSESVGAYKVDYAEAGKTGFDSKVLAVIRTYLLHTGLMFRG